MLVKKTETKKELPFKVIVVDVTVGESDANYTAKLDKLIEFRDHIVLNNKDFFDKVEFEVWIVCPKLIKTKTDDIERYKLRESFKNKLKQLDGTDQNETLTLTLKFVAFDEI